MMGALVYGRAARSAADAEEIPTIAANAEIAIADVKAHESPRSQSVRTDFPLDFSGKPRRATPRVASLCHLTRRCCINTRVRPPVAPHPPQNPEAFFPSY